MEAGKARWTIPWRQARPFAGLAPKLAGVFQVIIQVPPLAPGDYALVITGRRGLEQQRRVSISAA